MTQAQTQPSTPPPADPQFALRRKDPLWRRIVGWLDPAEWIGPVFTKEVRTTSRKFSTIAGRSVYVFLLTAAVWVAYAGSRADQGLGGGRVERIQDLQRIAPTLTVAVMWVQATVLVFLAPSTTAGSLSDERRRRTLDVLLTTPVTAWRIALGKLSAAMLTLGLLALSAIPVQLAVRVLGGVEVEYIFAGTAIVLSLALMGASLAMLNSLWCKKASTATFLAFIMQVALVGGPALVAGLIATTMVRTGGMRGGPPTWLIDVLATCSPFTLGMLATQMLGGFMGAGFGAFSITQMWIATTVYNIAVTAVIFGLTTLFLRRVMLSVAAGGTPDSVAFGRVKRSVAVARRVDSDGEASPPPTPAEDMAARAAASGLRVRTSREVGDQPVLWREMNQPLFRKKWIATLVLLGVVAFSLLMLVSAGGESEVPVTATTMTYSVILLLQAASLTVGGIAGEREAKTWETLLATTLTAREIVMGKFLGALRSLWLLPAVILVNALLLGVLWGAFRGMLLVHLVLILAGPCLLLAAMGTRLSLTSKSASAAGTRNTLFGLAIWAGLPLTWGLGELAIELMRLRGQVWSELSNVWGDFTLIVNPPVMIVSALQGGFSERVGSWNRYFLGNDGGVSMGTFTAVAFGVFVGYCAVTMLVLWWTCKSFAKKSGRVS
ncbi:MAG: ABC transporter permease subunit [Planctomycetota bacterium]